MRPQQARSAVVGVLTVLTLLSLSGCGSGPDSASPDSAGPDSAGPDSASPDSASGNQTTIGTSRPNDPSTRSNAPNPCLPDDSEDTVDPPNSSPSTEGYLGLSESDAEKYAAKSGQQVRIAGRDGECFAMTMDYRPNRVNLYLEDDEVVAATIG